MLSSNGDTTGDIIKCPVCEKLINPQLESYADHLLIHEDADPNG